MTILPDRASSYRALVADRKACRLCEPLGLTNPAALPYDSDEIGPWTLWQGALDAEVMVVGQDWGDVDFFIRNQGSDAGVSNPTNKRLQQLLASAGLEVGPPRVNPRSGPAFFTNAILCLKRDGLQAAVQAIAFRNCAAFLRREIEIVSPAVVVALGYSAYRAVCVAFALKPAARLLDALERAPETLPTGGRLVAVYHCGNWGTQARTLSAQKGDWERVRRPDAFTRSE